MSDEQIAASDEERTLSDSEESTISDYQSAISDEGNTSGPVFGPPIARTQLPNPLGKKIRLRIEIEGARGLPQTDTSSEGSDTRSTYHSISFENTSHGGDTSYVRSSRAREGLKSLRGTVQRNEVLYIECLEFSLITITVSSPKNDIWLVACATVGDLLKNSEIARFAFLLLKSTKTQTRKTMSRISAPNCGLQMMTFMLARRQRIVRPHPILRTPCISFFVNYHP
ncbi:hypothetical protein PENSPDRAFT_174299 [Peniophora sp. CONT]|nr:hypothetical protein PENSPDRAFT_174299 [Peniophora sp. CONT]